MTLPVLDHPEPGVDEARQIEEFWREHFAEFREQFSDCFVAVKDGKVVAVNADLEGIVEQLEGLSLDPRTDVAIEFIPSQGNDLFL